MASLASLDISLNNGMFSKILLIVAPSPHFYSNKLIISLAQNSFNSRKIKSIKIKVFMQKALTKLRAYDIIIDVKNRRRKQVAFTCKSRRGYLSMFI